MQIQQSIQNILGTVSHIPPQVLADLVVGQTIEAAVVKAALAAQIASLRIGESLVDVRTPVPLQRGQSVQLELVQSGEKPVFKLVSAADIVQPTTRTSPAQAIALVPGQQLMVEVIKLLSDNRLLVATPKQILSSGTSPSPQPLQFDIDISKLAKTFTVGEKVVVEITTVKPLALTLKAEPLLREQLVVDRIKQLLPQLDSKPSLAAVNNALKTLSLPSTVQGEVNRLVHHILDKQRVNQPQALKQAIQSSGVFTEKALLKQSHFLGGDFKANLLKIASVLELELGRKVSPVNKITAQASNVLQRTPPLQTLSSTSLGKSQTASTLKQAVVATQQQPISSVSAQASRQQGQVAKLHSPFSFQTSSTKSADVNVGQAKGEGDVIKGRGLTSPFAFQTQSTKNAVANVSQTKVEAKAIKDQGLNSQSAVTPNNTAQAAAPRLTLLSTILQTIGAYSATPASVSVLNASPLNSGLPTALPPFLESILTPSQASALVQALNKSIAAEGLRVGGQLDVLVLQGLLKEVESLHARIQLNQFSMIKEPESQAASIASWLIDLPLKDKLGVEFLQLQIDQFKEQRDGEEEEIWNVQLRLDTQNLGPLQATVTMHVDDIKIVLRAEQPESAALLEQNLPWLHDALARLGVSVSHVSCSCGEVVKPTLAEQYLAETTSLVDVSV
jgi:flagellar hook-length control protein FliK